MKKLSLNTIRRFGILNALTSHKYNDIAKYNRALKIAERVELTKEEKETIQLREDSKTGTISWGKTEDGEPIEGFEDIVAEVELSDEMGELLKEIIEGRVKEGVTLSAPTDRALVEVNEQLLDPTRSM